MTRFIPCAPSYRKALAFSALVQLLVITISGTLILDFGLCLQVSLISATAYWAGALVLIQRHPHPTELHLSLLRIGYLLTLLLAALVAPLVWHLRGVW